MAESSASIEQILERIKEFYGFRFDAALCQFFGITSGALSNWKRRGTIDFGLVVDRCRELNEQGEQPNLHWIIEGNGAKKAPQVEKAGMSTNSEFAVMNPKGLKGKKVVEFVDVFDELDQKLLEMQEIITRGRNQQ